MSIRVTPQCEKIVKEIKGKNFSRANTGKRIKGDEYKTPYSIVEQFIERKEISDRLMEGTILEPSSGEPGEAPIVKMLSAYGFGAWLTHFDIATGTDFFKTHDKYDTVITNPPYSCVDEFILHAKEIARKNIMLLLPIGALQGASRYRTIYSDVHFPLVSVYVFTRMPMLCGDVRDDGCYKTGMQAYAWYVWERNDELPIKMPHAPRIYWIDNQEYVLRKPGSGRPRGRGKPTV